MLTAREIARRASLKKPSWKNTKLYNRWRRSRIKAGLDMAVNHRRKEQRAEIDDELKRLNSHDQGGDV